MACLTEKILNVRAHLLKHVRDQQKKKILSIWLSRRQRIMKYLYRVDYDLYKHACETLSEQNGKESFSRGHQIEPKSVAHRETPLRFLGGEGEEHIEILRWCSASMSRCIPDAERTRDGETLSYSEKASV